MDGTTLGKAVQDLRDLLERKAHVRGRTFARQVKKARRRLPKHVYRDLSYLVDAEEKLAHPRMYTMIDFPRAAKAERNARYYLDRMDLKAERRARLIDLLALNMFYLLLISGCVIALLKWRGYI